MEINLSKNLKAIIDEEDYELVSLYKWHVTSHKYAGHTPAPGKCIYMHRLILNVKKGEVVDHINGNTLDNRKSNLRICKQNKNVKNRKKSSLNKTGYKGTFKVNKNLKKDYTAQIQVDSKRIHLGYFATVIEAAEAYNEAAIKYFGEYAQLNIIGDDNGEENNSN